MTTSLTKLTKAVDNYRNATNPTQRDAARRFAGKRAEGLAAERDVIMHRLAAGDDWLTAHPDHPDHDSTEELWLADLVDYELAEDALANAFSIFTGCDDVQERRAA